MILGLDHLTRLLGSIEADRLVILCGAGLSVSPPSDLMSAVRVARTCYDAYKPIKVLPPDIRDKIDEIAGYFHGTGEFESLFIGKLVPWNELVGEPNAGHAAVSDFLICRAAYAVLSANFDSMIEQWASSRKIRMRGALDGVEAMNFGGDSNPLVKFHGCLVRSPEDTLWTKEQLRDAKIAARVKACSEWIKLTLPGKDLLIVGFWTDWGYLNDVLAEALTAKPFGSVTVVDTASTMDLETKAPKLWSTLVGGSPSFKHVKASGADVLGELRAEFSKTWVRKFYALGRGVLETAGKVYSEHEPDMNCDDLYDCRRDAEGVPYNRAARRKTPPSEAALASFLHHLLIEATATREGAWYRIGGNRVRVVNGAGQSLNSVREQYREPPALSAADIVVCAGAADLSVPGSIIGSGAGASIVHPSGGGGARWMTLEQARGELGI
jgi:hypothetical protein